LGALSPITVMKSVARDNVTMMHFEQQGIYLAGCLIIDRFPESKNWSGAPKKAAVT
jgi:hypothetical protein